MITQQLLLLLILVIQCQCEFSKPHEGKLIESKAPRVHLDLNVEPRHRWDQILPQFTPMIQTFAREIMDKLPITQLQYRAIGIYFTKNYKYTEFVEEVKGIGKATNIQWEKIMLANFLYEASTLPLCTSILAKNAENKILHGRNLDFPFYQLLSKMTAKVEVYKGDKYIGSWDQIIGSVIVLSGYNPNKISLTEDTRNINLSDWKDIFDAIFVKQYIPSAWLSRQVLQNNFSYEEAKSVLLQSNTTAPIYYILGGINNGIVIEKDFVGYHDYQELSQIDNWFIVKTNYDFGTSPTIDIRRTAATERMKEIGQEKINDENLFDLLKKYPTLNLWTIYSLIFSPSYQTNDIKLWYGNANDFNSEILQLENDYSLLLQDKGIINFLKMFEDEDYFIKMIQQLVNIEEIYE